MHKAAAVGLGLEPLCKTGTGAEHRACGLRDSLIWIDTNPLPEYPVVMREAGITGSATTTFSVRRDGTVDPASFVVIQSTNRAFEVPAKSAILQWIFRHAYAQRINLGDSLIIRVAFEIPSECPDSGIRSAAKWVSGASPPQVLVTACINVLVPRDEVH
jgi:outer membrane biosynthesis protein TonB